MTIEAFFLCYNESRMIEHTLNYYIRFCDKITIIDNQSTDNSVAIVKEKFPSVQVEALDTGGEYREDIQIKVRNNWWKDSQADFVIMADMDEFIVDPNLLGKLKEMKGQRIALPKVIGYNMYSNTFPEDYNTLITEQVTDKYRDRDFDKNIVFSPKWIKEMKFGPGSHYCEPVYKAGAQIEHSFELSLLHFKYLGREYLYEKHHAYGKRMSNMNRFFRYGYVYELGNEYVDNRFDKIEQHLKKGLPY